jgi:glycosyltransferase involved in cell wall biosynthesis
MNVGFFLNNANILSMDYRNLLEGNPGMGGTQYSIIAVAGLLSQRANNFDVVVYAQKNGFFNDNLKVEIVADINQAVEQAVKNEIPLMVIDQKFLSKKILLKYKEKILFVPWCHNFLTLRKYNLYNKQSSIPKIVHVSREQMDLYRDHPAFYKSEYIYNGFSIATINKYKKKLIPYNLRSNNVVYIGSLVRAKGFHILAKVWKSVLKSVPDVNLYVIGSGKLYNSNASLGERGIADSIYEQEFIQYLLDEDGEILPSVHFMGIMGKEKNDLLLQCKVGVPNPSGNTETFGYTAIEMQAMGCLVTTMRCPGYLDTVWHNGILYKSTSKLANEIIDLLQRDDNQYKEMISFLGKFDFNVIISQWEDLLYDCINGKCKKKQIDTPLTNADYHLKGFKEFLRKTKIRFPVFNFMPPVEIGYSIIKIITKTTVWVRRKIRI